MTRKEFSEKMVECREEAKCGKNELCRRAGLTFNQLQRLESASNNFSIDNVFSYLNAIKYKMYIVQGNNRLYFKNREVLAPFFKKLRESTGMSQKDFAVSVKLSHLVIVGIENNNKNTAIDSLLLCLQALNCQISFKN